jgi:hypothetical protein
MTADEERARLKRAWPDEFADGAKCGLTGGAEGPREPGGYPKTFHTWEIERRNSWWAGWNKGYCDRRCLKQEGGDG